MTEAAMRLLYTTWPDVQSAETAAGALLEARLIACANILPPSVSLYRWEGEIRRDAETVMLLKTAVAAAVAARDAVLALHPYDEPCVLDLAVEESASADGFLAWVRSETRG